MPTPKPSATALRIEHWPIGKVKPYPGNARKIPKVAVRKVADSIKQFGWRQPIVVDKKGVIVVGHTRHEAAKLLELKTVPVHVATDLTPQQIRLYRLADNRTNEETSWDSKLLVTELGELQAMGVDLAGSAFEASELEQLLAGATPDDRVVDVPKVATSRPGDLWHLGPHRLICADCTSAEMVARVLGDRAPKLMVTDPPYGVEFDNEWRDRAGVNTEGKAEGSYLKETGKSTDVRADWSDAFALVPSLEVAYVWHASKYTVEVLAGLLKIGFVNHQQIIWDKGIAVRTRTHYWFQHEPCWYVRKKNAPWFGRGGTANSTIWAAHPPKFIMGARGEQKYDHPTQKPMDLMLRSIRNHTKKGDFVYEPFSGSGTTLAACEKSGRIVSAVEINPLYVDVGIQRWQEMTGEEARLEGGDTFAAIATARSKNAGRAKAKTHKA